MSKPSPLVADVCKYNREAAPGGQSCGPVLAGVVGDPVRMQGVIWHKSPRQEENCRATDFYIENEDELS